MDDHRDRHLQWARDVKDLVPDLADDEYDEMCSQPDAIFNAQWEHHDRRWRRTEGLNRALEPRYALRMEANQDIAEKIVCNPCRAHEDKTNLARVRLTNFRKILVPRRILSMDDSTHMQGAPRTFAGSRT